MGVPSTPGRAAKRAGNNSIDFYFSVGLIGPVASLLVLWGVVAWVVLSGALDRMHWFASATPHHRTLADVTVLTGAGLLVVLAAVILLGKFARRLSREVRELAAAAVLVAGEKLPQAVEALRNGEQTVADAERLPAGWPEPTVSELAATAAAIASVHRSAVAAAAAEAALRNGFRQILVSLGRRNQSLLQRQLRIIDTLEQQASSPGALADLFSLDHLTTRMRRHAESLTILSGVAPGRTWSGPVPIIDVMRAAAAEVEDYTRVTVISDSDETVAAPAVTDMIHLLAELIENATLFSPSSTRVEVRAERVANGFAVEVEDRGLGIPPDQLLDLNAKLADPPDFDMADADRLGLFVAGRLAARHGVYVSLAPSPYRGTKAVVVLPDSVMSPVAENKGSYPERSVRESSQLNLRAPEVLSLIGVPAQPAPSAAGPLGDDPDPAAGAGSLAEPSARSTPHGLPRRIRPGSEQQPDGDLRLGSEQSNRPDGLPPRSAPVEAPAPEAARSLAASLQNSWDRSRKEPDSESEEGNNGS
jgi:signal transduction histidine kinase